MRIDRKKRNPPFTHETLKVNPGRLRTLGYGVGALIQDLVQDLQPLIGQADLVHIGISEEPSHLSVTVLRNYRSIFAPDIAGWFAHPSKKRF
jgi:hypothetical protein